MKEFGSEGLEFSGGGESTLHPDFERISESAHKMGYALGLLTNGTRLNAEFLSQHFKYVRIGIDAGTEETYNKIKRTQDKFQKVLSGIKACVMYKRKDFTVGLKVIINMINCNEIPRMIGLANQLEVDYIQFKSEHSSVNSISEKDRKFYEEILNVERQNGENRAKILGTLYHQQAITKCYMSPIHAVITAEGKILMCCYFPDRPIGTIEQPIREVWGSERHKEVIKMTTVQDCVKIDCRIAGYNQAMNNLFEDPLEQHKFI